MKKIHKVLLIVDMQQFFIASKDEKVLHKIISLAKIAIKHNYPIFILEFFGYGKTHEKINALLQNYSNVYYIKKYKDDGSSRIEKFLDDNKNLFKFPFEFKVCGAYTDACIAATVKGLHHNTSIPITKIKIIKDACASYLELSKSTIESMFINSNKVIVL